MYEFIAIEVQNQSVVNHIKVGEMYCRQGQIRAKRIPAMPPPM